jgi:hypothetical protein
MSLRRLPACAGLPYEPIARKPKRRTPVIESCALSAHSARPTPTSPKPYAPRAVAERLKHTRDAAALGAIAGVYVLLALILPVGRDFPIGDSWSYSWSAQQLCEYGVVRLGGFVAMTLVGQLLVTAPACALFPFDHQLLNLLTYFLSMLTMMLVYLSLRGLRVGVAPALLGVATVALNPVYLMQSNTYDTEVYFLFASFLGILCLIAWDRDGRTWQIWLAGIAFALAILIRQHAIVFFLGGLVYVLSTRGRRRSLLFPWTLAPIALAGCYLWLNEIHGIPIAFQNHQAALQVRLSDPSTLALESIDGAVQSAHYLGLYLLPLLPILIDRSLTNGDRRWRAVAFAFMLLLIAAGTAGFYLGNQTMPYLPNVVSVNQVLKPFGQSVLPGSVALLLTLTTAGASIVVGIWMLGELRRTVSRPSADNSDLALRRFLVIVAVLLVGFTILNVPRFDRYLIVPLPVLLLLALAGPIRPGRVALGCVIGLPIALFSVYFVEERIRDFECEWRTAEGLVAAGYSPDEIDGGWAFNGWHDYSRAPESSGERITRSRVPVVLVRGMAFPHPLLEHMGSRVCESRWGTQPYEFHVYKRIPQPQVPQ